MNEGLFVSTYRVAGRDCTNNGVTSKHDSFILVGDNIPTIFKPTPERPVLVLKEEMVCGGIMLRAYPTNEDGEIIKNTMFGGNFIYSPDSRFPSDHPIKVFDRIEHDI